MKISRRLLLAAALFGACGSAHADDSIIVMNAFVRPPLNPAVKVGALYMALMNHGGNDDVLLKVTSEVSTSIELHESKEENGVASMRAVDNLIVPAGGMVDLKPGGLHAMLIGIKTPLKPGDKIEFVLTFEKAGEVRTTATVGEGGSGHDMKME